MPGLSQLAALQDPGTSSLQLDDVTRPASARRLKLQLLKAKCADEAKARQCNHGRLLFRPKVPW